MLLFTLIAVAVDSSEKTDDFVKTGLSTGQIITQYYFGFVPWIWGLLYPLFVFIAVIFFTSKMAFRSEIIAILASGTSYNRWLRPYFIGGIIFAFQTAYFDKTDPTKNINQSDCRTCFYLRLDSVTYVSIKYFDTASKTSSGFYMEKVRNNKVFYNLRADQMKWDTAKNNWQLTNVVERRIDSMKEVITQLPLMNINLNLKPADLRKDEYLKDKLSTPALKEYIQTEKQRGREGLNALQVEMYRRAATPFTVLLLTLIGAIVAGRKVRGGSGLHLAIGIVIAVAFIVLDRFSTVFSIKGNFPPLLAAWVPNILFSFVAYYLYRKAPK
jgi:lipopolysaccharide export system permease protein